MFRKEVLSAKNEKSLGTLHAIQPITYTVFGILVGGIGSLVCICLLFAHYTQHKMVTGELITKKIVLDVSSKQSGQLIKVLVQAGQYVQQGEALFEVMVHHSFIRSTPALSSLNSNQYIYLKQSSKGLNRQQNSLLQNSIPNKWDMMAILFNVGVFNSSLTKLNQIIAQTRIIEISPITSQLRWRFLVLIDPFLFKTKYEIVELYRDNQKILQQLLELQKSIEKYFVGSYFVVRAPESGTIHSVLMTPGSILNAAETVLTIETSHSDLQAQLMVPIQMVGFLKKGDKVTLHYHSYPYQKFGLQYGKIVEIDYSCSSSLHSPSLNGENYSTVFVSLDKPLIEMAGKSYSLLEGMLLRADILLERRTLLEWLFKMPNDFSR